MGDVVDDVRVEWLKWPERPYRRMSMRFLKDDEWGTWLWAPEGTTFVYSAADSPQPLPVSFLTLVPSGGEWWVATWMYGHDTIVLYVDIVCGTPSWSASRDHVRIVDLDLDVMRLRDGSVVIDDEDEFAANSSALAYPADVVSTAWATANLVAALVRADVPPLGRTPPATITPSPPPNSHPTQG